MLYSQLAETYKELEGTSKRLEKTYILTRFFKKLNKEEDFIIHLVLGRVFPEYEEKVIGISTQLVIKAIAKSTGTTAEEISKEWRKIGDLGEVAEKLIGKKSQTTLFTKRLSAEKVYENIKKAAEFQGKGAVENKINQISELLSSASGLEAKYITRTVLEDLRTGTGEGTIRDAIVMAVLPPILPLYRYCEDCSCFVLSEKCHTELKELNKEEAEKLAKKLKLNFVEKYNEKDLKNILIFSENGREIYNNFSAKVQQAYDITNDFAEVFKAAKENKLDDLKIHPGIPLKVMLALKAKNVQDGFETVGSPAAFEFKYDGFRMLIHKNKNEISAFTRRLENVTKQFPEVIEYIKKNIHADSFIIDSEAVGFNPKNKNYRPFQEISQRIKRKYDIEELKNKLPVELNIFDILYLNGKSLLKEPFIERRKVLEKLIKQERYKLVLARQLITENEKEAQKFFEEAIKEKQEGVMIKNLNAPYKPGARVGYMLKLKPELRDFDLVITGAEYGTGKRSGWLSSFILSCKDGDKLLEIGRISTGIKEKESEGVSYQEITKLLKPLIEKTMGRIVKVKAKIVMAVTYQEIQKSPSYSSGFALRFPRFTALRIDKLVGDIATLDEVKREYNKQG